VKLCQIDIEKSMVSPLFWALHDSKHDLVDFILNELLTIRADLHGYYYGREMLFKHHPDLVGILGRNGQQLLVTLLDGEWMRDLSIGCVISVSTALCSVRKKHRVPYIWQVIFDKSDNPYCTLLRKMTNS